MSSFRSEGPTKKAATSTSASTPKIDAFVPPTKEKKGLKPQKTIEDAANYADDYEASKVTRKDRRTALDDERRLVEELNKWNDSAGATSRDDDDF
jgi:hypothetical protein